MTVRAVGLVFYNGATSQRLIQVSDLVALDPDSRGAAHMLLKFISFIPTFPPNFTVS